jgi:hypothetical protein
MVVKVSKPELNLREKISELDKPSGVAGEAMLRAETPQEQFNLIGAGRRNLLINGDFQVSQRGDFTSSQTLGTSFQYYVDRWRIYAFNNDLGYIQHFLDQSLPDGSYANTLRITSGDSDLLAPLVQHVENHKIVWGRDFTFSFWYKSTSDNMYNLWNGTSQVHFLLPDTAGTWVKFEKTFKFKENGAQLRIEYYSHTATFHSGAYLELANLQLELGKVATPFEHRSYGEELELCKRYFQNIYNGQCFGSANTTTRMRINAPLSPTMRTTPTVARVAGTISFQGMGVGFNSTSTAVAQGSPSGPDFLGFDLAGFTSLTARAYAGSQSQTLVFTASAEI